VTVRFVYIGGIVDHHCLKFPFNKINISNSERLTSLSFL
jgi:hypothetical protein